MHKEAYDACKWETILDRAEQENKALVKPKNHEENHPAMIFTNPFNKHGGAKAIIQEDHQL
jgi:hypothetical protein